jgi:hypothetical protein
VSLEKTNVSEVRTASIIRAMALVKEAVRTFETSVYSNETALCYIPVGSNLSTRRCENLKSDITVKRQIWTFLEQVN